MVVEGGPLKSQRDLMVPPINGDREWWFIFKGDYLEWSHVRGYSSDIGEWVPDHKSQLLIGETSQTKQNAMDRHIP